MLPYIRPTTIKLFSNKNKINSYINIITHDKTSSNEEENITNEYRNINSKISKDKLKINIFSSDILYIQHAYQFSIITIIGMVMYKTPDLYQGNIFYNEKILMVTDSKKPRKKKEEDEIEKPKTSIMYSNSFIVSEMNEINIKQKNNNIDLSNEMFSGKLKEKSKNNIMDMNSLIISDLDATSATNSLQVDNTEEYNNLMDGNINIDKEIINEKHTKKSGKQAKVHFSVDDMFENIKEDDTFYNIFKEYREEVDNNDDD
jgi:hypothetical protein